MLRLQATNIAKRFGNRILFRKMTVELRGGCATAITGLNGSGKSTLIRILAGVLRPTQGKVLFKIGDRMIVDEARPFHVGLVAPYLNLYEAFSPAENLRFLARARGISNADHQIADVLARVGLSGRQDDYVTTFSSGMKQRVRIAAALVCSPDILMLDEPRSNLDDVGKELVTEVVQMALREDKIVVIATNDAAEAAGCEEEIRIQDYS